MQNLIKMRLKCDSTTGKELISIINTTLGVIKIADHEFDVRLFKEPLLRDVNG